MALGIQIPSVLVSGEPRIQFTNLKYSFGIVAPIQLPSFQWCRSEVAVRSFFHQPSSIVPPKMEKYGKVIYNVRPPSYKLVNKSPSNYSYLRTINHSYRSYVHQLNAILGASHCIYTCLHYKEVTNFYFVKPIFRGLPGCLCCTVLTWNKSLPTSTACAAP